MPVSLGTAREFTDRRRNRHFACDQHLSILGDGAEPL